MSAPQFIGVLKCIRSTLTPGQTKIVYVDSASRQNYVFYCVMYATLHSVKHVNLHNLKIETTSAISIQPKRMKLPAVYANRPKNVIHIVSSVNNGSVKNVFRNDQSIFGDILSIHTYHPDHERIIW